LSESEVAEAETFSPNSLAEAETLSPNSAAALSVANSGQDADERSPLIARSNRNGNARNGSPFKTRRDSESANGMKIGGDDAATAATTADSPTAMDSPAHLQTAAPTAPRRRAVTPNGYVYILAFSAAVGGFLFGYDTGVVSGAMIPLKKEFQLDDVWIQAIVSATIASAALSALVSGVLNDVLGRRPVILIASAVFTIGAIVLGAAIDKPWLLIGRIILGIGIGLTCMTSTMYISEIAPAEVRGRLVTVNNAFLTGGQFIAAVVDGAFIEIEDGWRYMLGVAAIPSILQFVAFLFLPESPRWLVSKGQPDKAREVLLRIRSEVDAEKEFEAILENHENSKTEAKTNAFQTLRKMLGNPSVRRALVVGCGLQMYQQIAGINTIMYYSATIIKMSGVSSDSHAVWLAALTAFINFSFTFVGLVLVERVGRRKLVLGSIGGVTISLALLAVGFQLSAFISPPTTDQSVVFPNVTDAAACAPNPSCSACVVNENCGFCMKLWDNQTMESSSCIPLEKNMPALPYSCKRTNETNEQFFAELCPSPYAWMSTAGMVIYLMFFASGMGPMPWTINAEIYPTWARSTGNGLASSVNWTFNMIVSMTFLSLLRALTPSGAFWLYSALAATGFLFLFLLLPETKEKSLEEMEELFSRSFFWSKIKKSTKKNSSISLADNQSPPLLT